MSTNTELIARLRETYPATYCFTDIPHIAIEAADAIEALEAERDSLAHHLNRQKQWKDAMRDKMRALENQLAIERRHNERATNYLQDHRDALEDQLAAAQGQEPVAWLVFDEYGLPSHATIEKSMAHEHITDALQEHGITEAAKWKVKPVYAAPIPQQVAEPALSVPDWKSQLEAVVDIYFDGTENPEEHRTYVDGAFAEVMNDSRVMLAAAPQPKDMK